MSNSITDRRILFLIARSDAFGGSSLHVMNMASSLRDENHEVCILIGGTRNNEVTERLADAGLNFTCIPELGREIDPVKDFKSVVHIRKIIKEFSPDLISLHASKAGGIGRIAALGLGIPTLYTPHCWSFAEGFPHAKLYRAIEFLLAPVTSKIIAVSDDERDLGLSNRVGTAARTMTIHNGVHDTFKDFARSQRSNDLPLRLLSVARFEKQKDQPLLLEALSHLTDQNWHLTLVGEGPHREECEALAIEYQIADRVDFVGYSDDVEAHLKKNDLFLLVTKWEGFPRSILEAMSASLPVLTSDVGGCCESVLDGVTGRLVPKSNLKRLIEALREMMSDRKKLAAMGEASRARYKEHFQFETMYSKYTDLYNALCHQNAHSYTLQDSPREVSLHQRRKDQVTH